LAASRPPMGGIQVHKGSTDRAIPEAVLRANIAFQLGIQPEDVTGDQLLQEVGQLIRHYGVVELIPGIALRKAPHADDLGGVPEDAIDAPVPKDTSLKRDLESPISIPAKGNGILLKGKLSVNFRTAEEYLGITERQRQKLVSTQALQVVGKGHNRKITTESLINYLPAENPN